MLSYRLAQKLRLTVQRRSTLTIRKEPYMKTKKSFAAGVVLSMFMAISISAGDMPGPGFVQDPPKSGSTTSQASVDPPGQCPAQTGATNTCEEATPDPVTEAMIIAIQLLTSVW